MRFRRCIFYYCLFAVVFFNHQCSPKNETPANDAETVKIDGSSTVYPITQEIVELYKKTHNNLIFSVSVSGTGGGFEKFCQSQIVLNNASRAIKQKEIDACSAKGINYRAFEVAYDGIAVVISTENTWVDYLTVEELRFIWKKDGAKTWSDVRSGWPDQLIGLYGPGEASGTYDYFKEAILESDSIKSAYIKSENDNLLAKGVSKDKFAIGFFGLAYFKEYQDVLKLVPISNNQNPVFPTIETVASGKYVPLSRPLFIYVNEVFYQTISGKAFLKFYLENAAEFASKVGYVALPSNKYQVAISEL